MIYVVLAKEYDSDDDPDVIVLITHDKARAEQVREDLEKEWHARKNISKWVYSFIVLEAAEFDVQYVTHTYGLANRLDKATNTFVDYPPEANDGR